MVQHLLRKVLKKNYMKLSKDNYYFLVAGFRDEVLWAKTGEARIWGSTNEKLLGSIINKNLNYDDYMLTLSENIGRNLGNLS